MTPDKEIRPVAIAASAGAPAGSRGSEIDALRDLARHHGRCMLLLAGADSSGVAAAMLEAAMEGFTTDGDAGLPQLFVAHADIDKLRETWASIAKHPLAEYCCPYPGAAASLRFDLPLPFSLAVIDDQSESEIGSKISMPAGFLPRGSLIAARGRGSMPIGEKSEDGPAYEVLEERDGIWILSIDGNGSAPGLTGAAVPATVFEEMRAKLIAMVTASDEDGPADAALLRDLTRPAREAIRQASESPSPIAEASSRLGWPWRNESIVAAPASLPDGKPWPRISIVIPSFNYGNYVEQTILSILRQDYPNLELIVTDGGSTDGTPKILERYRDRFKFMRSAPDRGQSHAINEGFSHATGEIYTWVNADDMLAPGALFAAAMAFFESRADMVAGICRQYRDGQLVESHLTSCSSGPLDLAGLLDLDHAWNIGRFFMQPEVLFTRTMWERAGGYVDESLFYSMDYDLWLRFAAAGATLRVIGRPIAHFRVHANQKTFVAEKFIPELRQARANFLARGKPGTAAASSDRAPASQRANGNGVASDIDAPANRPPMTRRGLRIAFFNDIGFHYGAGLAHKRLAMACALARHEIIPVAGIDISRDAPRKRSAASVVDAIAAHKPDMVVIGNLHYMEGSAHTVQAIAARWPACFVMHDQWAMTGRCAYTGACEKFIGGCDASCPTANEYPSLPPELVAPAWEEKREVFGTQDGPVLLTTSQWMACFANDAITRRKGPAGFSATDAAVRPIRCGFELDLFRPLDKAWCRRALGLPPDKLILLASGSEVRDRRKGLDLLIEAVRTLNDPEIMVVSLGFREADAITLPIDIHYLGYVNDPKKLALVYNAADIFVGPSREEAFGQVFIEAAACATPSIGFHVGGVPEAVIDGVTGLVPREVSAAALADAISTLATRPALRRDLGAYARLVAENNWSLEAAYHSLFVAWQAAGLTKQLGLAAKIGFGSAHSEPPPTHFVPCTDPPWLPLSGITAWQDAPDGSGLPRYCCMMGGQSSIRVEGLPPGRHQMFVRCTHEHEHRLLRVVHGGVVLAQEAVPSRSHRPEHVTVCQIDVPVGGTTVVFDHWPWETREHPISLLLLGISFARV